MKKEKRYGYQKTIILGFIALYIVCMVFATFLLKEKYKEDYKKQASNVINQLNAICSSGSLTIKDAEGNDNEEEIDKIRFVFSSIFSNVDKYNHLNAALYGSEGEIVAQTTEYFGENPIYDYFSEEEVEILFDYLEKAYQEDKKGDKLQYMYKYDLTYHQESKEPVSLNLYRVTGQRTTATDEYGMTDTFWKETGEREFLWGWKNEHIENQEGLKSDFSKVSSVSGSLTGLFSVPYFSEGRSIYEKWKNNKELQTFDVSKSRFDGTCYLPSSYEGEEGVNTVIYPVYVHQEIVSVADYNKRQYAIQLNQATDPWHAAVEYMKYVYVFGFLFMAVGMAKTLRTTGKAYQKQEELEQTRRDFTNAVAHELKTPLAIMRNLMENMEREQSEEKNSYYRQEAIRQTEVMDQLVQEMMLISKLDADKATKTMASVSVTEIVEEQLEKLEPQRKEKNIKVELWKEDDFIINGEKSYLEKAIFNLLENAISHNRIDGKIALWIDKDCCRIENTAEPIPEEDKEHLYDMFFTGNKSRNGEKKHNGLGLYLAKRIFDRYGVILEVKNTDIGVKVEFRVG